MKREVRGGPVSYFVVLTGHDRMWDKMSKKNAGHKLAKGFSWIVLPMVCLSMASCATTQKMEPKKQQARSKEYFSEKEYGVKASPRVADGKNIPKGGGRYMLGQPYQVKGKTYVPKEEQGYNKTGLASWYGSAFHGRLTANGEVYDQLHLSAAHPTFPLPSYARVTNLDTGSSVVVRVNDRGPYHPGRIIDVSNKAAELLDFQRTGTGRVNVQYVGRAPLDGHDMPYLMASYVRKGDRLPSIAPEGQIATGVMVASNERMGSSSPMRRMESYQTSGSMQTSLSGSTPSGGNTRPSAFAMMSASTAAAEAASANANAKHAATASAVPLPASRPMASVAPATVRAAAPVQAAPRVAPAPVPVAAAAPVMQVVPRAPAAAKPVAHQQAPMTAVSPSKPNVALVWTTGAAPISR